MSQAYPILAGNVFNLLHRTFNSCNDVKPDKSFGNDSNKFDSKSRIRSFDNCVISSGKDFKYECTNM